jgi:hypothetical protein
MNVSNLMASMRRSEEEEDEDDEDDFLLPDIDSVDVERKAVNVNKFKKGY